MIKHCHVAFGEVDYVDVIAAASAIFGWIIISVNGKTAGTAKVTVRTGTKKNSTKVTEWTIGTPVAIAAKDGDYYLAEGKGRRGWIHKQYLTLEGADTDGQKVDEGE